MLIVYTTRGKYRIDWDFRLGDVFVIFFLVPKIVPKVSIFIDISQLLFISKTIHYLVLFPSGFCAVLINIHSTMLEQREV